MSVGRVAIVGLLGVGALWAFIWANQATDRAQMAALEQYVATHALAECTASDAGVTIARVQNESNMYYRFTGELVNRCAQPVGIHVRFSAYDKQGKLMAVEEPWPASVRNVAANSREPFTTGTMHYDRAIKTFDAKVIEVKQWHP